MSLYESVCHTFATLATGGFSTRNASVGAYHSVTGDLIILAFMVLAGANFGLYHQLIRGKICNVWRDTELRVYLCLIGGASLLVAGSIYAAGEPIIMTDGTAASPTVGTALQQGHGARFAHRCADAEITGPGPISNQSLFGRPGHNN